MHKMKLAIAMLAMTANMLLPSLGSTVSDVYTLTIRLCVPQVLDNTDSTGKRVYRNQILRGKLRITYPDGEGFAPVLSIEELENCSFLVGGAPVTYTVRMAENLFSPMMSYIGNNQLNMFNVATICFYMEALPSYAISKPDADNAFYLMCAGRAAVANTVPTRFRGYVAGTQGCSCSDYGHTSPTRKAGSKGNTDEVTDIAAVFGTWSASFDTAHSRIIID